MNVFIVLLDIIDRVMECLGIYTGKIICGYVQIYIMCKQHMPEKIYTSESDVHTISLDSLCSSLTINIMSKRERMVGMKSMFSSPLVSSQRPYTLLAAARTEHLEFRVVVIPAYKTQHLQLYIIHSLQSAAKKLFTSHVNLG